MIEGGASQLVAATDEGSGSKRAADALGKKMNNAMFGCVLGCWLLLGHEGGGVGVAFMLT